MSYNKNTDYAINKLNPNKIIYSSVTDETHYFELKDKIVTEYYINSKYPEESYTRICDEISVDEFEKLKEFSDESYHIEEKETKNSYHVKNHISKCPSLIKTKEFSIEDYFDNFELSENLALERENNLKIALEILESMTEIQRKRFLMHVIEKKSTRKIAEIENVANMVIWRSINASKKKIKKYFEKLWKIGLQNSLFLGFSEGVNK